MRLIIFFIFTMSFLSCNLKFEDKRDWNPSFNKNSTDPFGCYYFDSILTFQNPKYSSASYEDIDEVFNSQTENKNIIAQFNFTMSTPECKTH